MPADRAAFRKLVSVHVIPKTRVPCVTRVTANRVNDLADHSASATCVTGVTQAPVETTSYKLRDQNEKERVTGRDKIIELLSYFGHAVTRSRTENDLGKRGALDGSPEAAVLTDWLSYYGERAAIREYEGGFDRAEAERRARDEAVAALGPKSEEALP
jgi:hypothetical protein